MAPRPAPLDPDVVAARLGGTAWQVVGKRIAARFRAASFTEAARFALDVAAAADAADHHPDIDLRYPGVARIEMTTHDRGALTELDISLAERISALAATAGLVADTPPPA